MEIEKVEEVKEPIIQAGEKDIGAKGTKWIKDEAVATKTCDACGAVMRGWAYREPFQFCPKCGAMADKAV